MEQPAAGVTPDRLANLMPSDVWRLVFSKLSPHVCTHVLRLVCRRWRDVVASIPLHILVSPSTSFSRLLGSSPPLNITSISVWARLLAPVELTSLRHLELNLPSSLKCCCSAFVGTKGLLSLTTRPGFSTCACLRKSLHLNRFSLTTVEFTLMNPVRSLQRSLFALRMPNLTSLAIVSIASTNLLPAIALISKHSTQLTSLRFSIPAAGRDAYSLFTCLYPLLTSIDVIWRDFEPYALVNNRQNFPRLTSCYLDISSSARSLHAVSLAALANVITGVRLTLGSNGTIEAGDLDGLSRLRTLTVSCVTLDVTTGLVSLASQLTSLTISSSLYRPITPLPPLPSLTELNVESLTYCPGVLPLVRRLTVRSNPFASNVVPAVFFLRFPQLRELDAHGPSITLARELESFIEGMVLAQKSGVEFATVRVGPAKKDALEAALRAYPWPSMQILIRTNSSD